MGSIYKRGEVYWIKYYRAGKPLRESTRSRKEADAKRLLKRREGEISEGKLPGIFFDKVTFEELAEALIVDYKVNKRKTLAKVERQIRLHLEPFFGALKIPAITTARIQKYTHHRLEEGASNATCNRELACLKRMLHLGARETPPRVNRVPFIPMLKEDNVRTGFFEHHEFEALRDALPDELKGFLTFGYKTGWRISEIVSLIWDQVDMKQGIVRLEVGDTKNTEGRTVYLDDELKEIIHRQFVDRQLHCPYVFNRDGQQIRDIRGSWKAGCKQTGLERRLFHDLRRTAVRNMVRSGIPENIAMKISGHKTRSVFDRYNIVSSDDLKQAAAKQEAYLKGLST
jgi:integrase